MGNGQSNLEKLEHNHQQSSANTLSRGSQTNHSTYRPSPATRPIPQPTNSYSSPLPYQQQPTPPTSLSSSPSPRPSYTYTHRSDDREYASFTSVVPPKRENSTSI